MAYLDKKTREIWAGVAEREARALGFNPKDIKATGAAPPGEPAWLSPGDVQRHAKANPRPVSAAARSTSVIAATLPADANPADYARNPLVDMERVNRPELVATASSERPAPTLFESGDLPPFTASGVDPQLLMGVPWQVRHPMASAPDGAQALALYERYRNDPVSAALEHGSHPGNQEYAGRVRSWLAGTG